jgi:hypothetical protein
VIGVKTTSLVLALVSVAASVHYFVAGLTGPENMVVYSRANVPVWGIRTWAVLLGVGGVLLLFPSTFRLATVLMMMNSLFTIACFVIAKDWRGGLVEFVFLQIPVLLFWSGYPRVRNRENQGSLVEMVGSPARSRAAALGVDGNAAADLA